MDLVVEIEPEVVIVLVVLVVVVVVVVVVVAAEIVLEVVVAVVVVEILSAVVFVERLPKSQVVKLALDVELRKCSVRQMNNEITSTISDHNREGVYTSVVYTMEQPMNLVDKWEVHINIMGIEIVPCT